MKNINIYIMSLAIAISCLAACKKQDQFLNKKLSITDVLPSTISDFQGMMDNDVIMNDNYPSLGEEGTDNFTASDVYLNSVPSTSRNAYLWNKVIYQGQSSDSWDYAYSAVEYANIVLDGLKNISPNVSEKVAYNNVEGQALFHRAMQFYMLAQDFCKPYVKQTATSDLGIVLRLTSDVNVKSVRATVQQTYDQMIGDLKTAVPLLPVTGLYQTRPSQASANALLAKIYLSMGDYIDAETYASKSLKQYNTLLDYNSPSLTAGLGTFPTYPNNPEISFYARTQLDANTFTAAINPTDVDSNLYNSYDTNDLRKTYLYRPDLNGGHNFSNDYGGVIFLTFCGIATNEIYLIRAESYARTNQLDSARADLNTLLIKRYKKGTYVPVTINDLQTLISRIILERRKELPVTAQLRWEDLRRLNQDPKFAVTLTRIYNGQTYTLPPNDPRYVLPIPDNEIQLTGIQQNSR